MSWKTFPTNRAKGLLLLLGFGFMATPALADTPLASGGNDTMVFSLLAGLAILQLILIMVVSSVIKRVAATRKLWFKDGEEKAGNANAKTLATVLALIGLTVVSENAMALSPEPVLSAAVTPLITMTKELFWWMVIGNAVLFGYLMFMVHVLQRLIKIASGVDTYTEPSWFEKWTAQLTDAVPIEQEADIEFDHKYDGIRELDNNLPPWWVAMFYGTIAFAVIYIGFYHFSGVGLSQTEEYQLAMREAEEAKSSFLATQDDLVDETNVTLLTDAASLEKGKGIFAGYCVACHGEAGEGNNGPNLTDEYWLHGGGITNVFSTVKYGVPAKGMQSWQTLLKPAAIQAVASYIVHDLQGSNPPNAKEAEGELWVPPVAPADSLGGDSTVVLPADSVTITAEL